jgi:phosphatidylglycerol:prolipoprotein diacylglycerol transferase
MSQNFISCNQMSMSFDHGQGHTSHRSSVWSNVSICKGFLFEIDLLSIRAGEASFGQERHLTQYFSHDFDLEIGRVLGLPVYWYGAVYTIGFVSTFFWLWFRRVRLGWNRRDVFQFSVFIAVGMLIGGRVFDILVYELGYYRQHPIDVINWWKGGLASHGVLLGCLVGVIAFCWGRRKPFLQLADEIVVPAAFLFAIGRLGNFIEGGVIGIETTIPWAVIYPDVEGARHPVALYESGQPRLIGPV